MSNTPKIYKTNGDLVPFDKSKVKESLVRSGARESIADQVTKQVAQEVEPKMSTTDIYRIAFNLLEEYKQGGAAARYTLKRSIMEFGPTGFPFEQFVGEILSHRGFETQVGVKMEGECVNHEVDVVAKKDDKHFLMECKFHHKTGIKTNVKVPMYIHSRFRDIQRKKNKEEKKDANHSFWVVTNTRFTNDATNFGECMGMNMLGWRHPQSGGLEIWIEETNLHPVTCLTTIEENWKSKLLKNDLVLCKDLIKNKDELKSFGLNEERVENLTEEAKKVCG